MQVPGYLPQRPESWATVLDDVQDYIADQIVEYSAGWAATADLIHQFLQSGDPEILLRNNNAPLDTILQIAALLEGRAD